MGQKLQLRLTVSEIGQPEKIIDLDTVTEGIQLSVFHRMPDDVTKINEKMKLSYADALRLKLMLDIYIKTKPR